jgi:hypothetical protein
MSPEGVKALLDADVAAAHAELKTSPVEALHLRGYQNEAILAVEAALAAGRDTLPRRHGHGHRQDPHRHRPHLPPHRGRALPPRALPRRPQRPRRADRRVIKDYKVASEKTFAQIFGFKELADASPDRDTRSTSPPCRG